jgi:hypothetical protein
VGQFDFDQKKLSLFSVTKHDEILLETSLRKSCELEMTAPKYLVAAAVETKSPLRNLVFPSAWKFIGTHFFFC